MIEIDGSHGEGGGQIFRTGLSLSVLTGKPVRIYNIRAGRKAPGLKPQHLMSAHAAARISDGRLSGAELGSTEIIFHPGQVRPGRYVFDVAGFSASAGSTGLIFQTVLLPLGFAGGSSHILFHGGTHVAWSPPAEYLREVFLHTVAPMGVRGKLEVPRWGFYPIGGGTVDVTVEPFNSPLRPLRIEVRGALKRLQVLSTVANLPRSIGKRQLERAVTRLSDQGLYPQGEIRTVESPGKGTFCFVLAEFDHLRAGFSALGEVGKRAEQVADEAVEAFRHYWQGGGALDLHLSDQVALPMALAGGESAVTVSAVTDHLKTNLWVIQQFIPAKYSLQEDPGKTSGRLQVTGIGYHGVP